MSGTLPPLLRPEVGSSLPGPFLRPGLVAASQAQWSRDRDRPRREQASLHSTTDFSASVQTAPFQSFFLFETDSQTQTSFVSLIIQVIKYLCFSVSAFPIRLKCFQYFKHPKVSLFPSQAPRQTGSQYYLNIINFMIAHRNDCFKLI